MSVLKTSNDLATRLAYLKCRTRRSYTALANRVGVSRSALHRYCTGDTIPTDFGVVERIGRVCGADRGELLDLHREWVNAVATRDRHRTDGMRLPTRDPRLARPAAGAVAVIALVLAACVMIVRRRAGGRRRP